MQERDRYGEAVATDLLEKCPVRARCPDCCCRFPWPTNVPWIPGEPVDGVQVTCPKCGSMVSILEEPYDAQWQAYYFTDSFGTGYR